MIGVNAPGKTTMLYKLKTGGIAQFTPTIDFNKQQIIFRDRTFDITEASGNYKLYDFFYRYMIHMNAIIIVVDSSQLSYGFYENLLQDTLKSCLKEFISFKNEKIPILILANKSDKSKHTDEEIISFTSINKYQDITFFKLIRTNCFTGEGLQEALEWIYENVQN
ncbi:hypothetical protein ABPG74_006685 [Tetrahymena malaccensis]